MAQSVVTQDQTNPLAPLRRSCLCTGRLAGRPSPPPLLYPPPVPRARNINCNGAIRAPIFPLLENAALLMDERVRAIMTIPTAKAGGFSVQPATHRLPSLKAVPPPVRCSWRHSRRGLPPDRRKDRYGSARSGSSGRTRHTDCTLRREARRDSHHHMTGSLSLVREDVEKRAPTRVVNALGERMVLHHPGHVQVFDTDTAVAARHSVWPS